MRRLHLKGVRLKTSSYAGVQKFASFGEAGVIARRPNLSSISSVLLIPSSPPIFHLALLALQKFLKAMAQQQQGSAPAANGGFWPAYAIGPNGVPVLIAAPGTQISGANVAVPAPVAQAGERLASGNQVQITYPQPESYSAFDYGVSPSPAAIYALPPQVPSAPPSGDVTLGYPVVGDEDVQPLLPCAEEEQDCKSKNKLRRKWKTFVKRVKDEHKNFVAPDYKWKEAPLIERAPFILSICTLACLILELIYMIALSPRRRTSVTLVIQLSFVIVPVIVQAILSFKMRFTLGLGVLSGFCFVFTAFMCFIALLADGRAAIFTGFDFALITIFLQLAWILSFRALRKSKEAATPAPEEPTVAV